jgi:hypothetical protein
MAMHHKVAPGALHTFGGSYARRGHAAYDVIFLLIEHHKPDVISASMARLDHGPPVSMNVRELRA